MTDTPISESPMTDTPISRDPMPDDPAKQPQLEGRSPSGDESAASPDGSRDAAPRTRLGDDLRHRLEYVLLRTAMEAAGTLPRGLVHCSGKAIGEFVYRVLRVRRKVVEENLRQTLGQSLDGRGIDQIARGVYHHLGRTLLEYSRFGHLTRARLDEWVEVRGLEAVLEAHAMGRGVILATGHFGNWELMGAVVSMRGYPVHFLAKEQRNPYVERYLNRSRAHLGVGLVHLGPELRRIYRRLREGEIVGMLFDQDAGAGGVFLDVLGRLASVQPGVAIFAQRTGAPIVPGCIVRLRDGRHRVSFEEPIHPDPHAARQEEIERLVRLSSQSLERFILRHPDQYYWVHRRWKTRPAT
jgi:KDO2-lipid IV(A) lauroyltransferase